MEKILLAQFQKVLNRGWLPYFDEVAEFTSTTTSLWLAIASRETNIENIRGDYRNGKYNGYGVVQVDIGTDPEYCKSWTPENVRGGLIGGAKIFLSKTKDTLNCVGVNSKVRSRSFVGKNVENDDLRRISTAAYNCGRWAHYHFSNLQNVDSTTTKSNYSRDVYDRAFFFAKFLDEYRGQDELKKELLQQGKYARPSHLQIANVLVNSSGSINEVIAEPNDSQENIAASDYHNDKETEQPVKIDDVYVNKGSIQKSEPRSSGETSNSILQTEEVVVKKNNTESDAFDFEDIKSIVTKFKSRILAIPTILFSGGITAFSYLKNLDHSIVIVGLTCTVLLVTVIVVCLMILKSKDRDRLASIELAKLKLQMQRESQSHALNVIQAQTASDPNKLTVRFE